jgi:hypothetical protein
VLSLNKKIFEGFNAMKEITVNRKSKITGDLGIKVAICSLEARVDT